MPLSLLLQLQLSYSYCSMLRVTKEFMDDLCSVNMPLYQAQKYKWKINYTLRGGEN